MFRTQIYLTEEERVALQKLAKESGRGQSELIREAVDTYVAQQSPARKAAALDDAAGMWRDRDDLPDFAKLRDEWDRGGNE